MVANSGLFNSQYRLEQRMRAITTIFDTDPAALRSELDNAQDEFYLSMTAFTISGEREGTGRDCYQLALRYNEAIDTYLDQLASQPPTWKVLREQQSANDWKSILANDLEYLAKFHPSRADQTPKLVSGNEFATGGTVEILTQTGM
jgi:hypothetical protein